MDRTKLTLMKGFYENELINNILPFWLNRSIDEECGGFFSCFDNYGKELISKNKYCWSQGRFIWIFAKMSMMNEVFTGEQRRKFLALSKHGADFVMKYCLVAPNVWRCVFLMDRDGSPIIMDGYDKPDISYTADTFIVMGLAKYALAAQDVNSYIFAKKLFLSYLDRNLHEKPTVPYQWSNRFIFQGRYQSVNWLASELYPAAEMLDPDFCDELKVLLKQYCDEMIRSLVDDKYNFREMFYAARSYDDSMLKSHINPGHAMVNMEYLINAGHILEDQNYLETAAKVIERTMEIGWDDEFGGYPHFCSVDGGAPKGYIEGYEDEFFSKMIPADWSDKLWWVEIESLCGSIRGYEILGNQRLLELHDRLFQYVFEKFPNPNREIREWVQILKRNGEPQDKVTAVPVKDPFHVSRSLILMIESLERMLKR